MYQPIPIIMTITKRIMDIMPMIRLIKAERRDLPS